jgi:hypothetical protein
MYANLPLVALTKQALEEFCLQRLQKINIERFDSCPARGAAQPRHDMIGSGSR